MRFGAKSITESHLEMLRSVFPPGIRLLELGSGPGSEQLAKTYHLTSVEDQVEWVGKYPTEYIHAPLKHTPLGTWYDPNIIRDTREIAYEGIFVDGPSSRATLGRMGFWVHHGLFRKDVPIVVDDVDRELERMTLVLSAWSLRRPYEIHRLEDRDVGVIRGPR